MSFPNIPNESPTIVISKDNAVNLLLASIAFEELGLSHVINAEAEKIQYVLGTLNGQTLSKPPTADDLVSVNHSVNQTLKSVIKTQMLLQFKLEDLLDFNPESPKNIHVNTATVTAVFNNQTYRASDSAYYHTKGGTSQ